MVDPCPHCGRGECGGECSSGPLTHDEEIDRRIDALADTAILAHKIVVHDYNLGTRALRAEEVRGILRHLLLPGSTMRGAALLDALGGTDTTTPNPQNRP